MCFEHFQYPNCLELSLLKAFFDECKLCLLYFFHRGSICDLCPCPFTLPELHAEVVRICIFMQADDSLSWSVLLFIAYCLWTTIACEILGCNSHIPFSILPTFVHDINYCSFCAPKEIVHLWSGCFGYEQYYLSQTPRAVRPSSFPPPVLRIPPHTALFNVVKRAWSIKWEVLIY